jgi:ATP-dependent helicase HepA
MPDVSRYRRHLAQLVPPMLEACDASVAELTQVVIASAVTAARASLEARVQRLRALAATLASVTDAEIAEAQAKREAILQALSGARPRLDAVRMAVSADFLSLR